MLPAFIFISMCVKWGDQGGVPPPSAPTPVIYSSWSNSDKSSRNGDLLNNTRFKNEIDDIFSDNAVVGRFAVRPGGSYNKKKSENTIIKGSKTIISEASKFWSSTVGDTIASVKRTFQSKEAKKKQELLGQLQTMPVRQVVVPNSTVLPPDVIRTAVKHSGIIGNPLEMDRVQELARILKRWYVRKGYVLNSVTGASLNPETATAEITLEELAVSKFPVEIVFCKEMVIDGETGDLMTFQKYRVKKQKELEHTSGGFRRFKKLDVKLNRKDLNTTFVKTTGRTKATKIAQAMNLNPGQPFQWIDDRWNKISSSGVFKVLRKSPEPASDGGVCLQVFVTEPPARHLEYGIGKSVWTNSWEGEVDFDWRNVFGGGEAAGVLVRRGTNDQSPSVRLRYGDDRFGLEGGYDVEVFSDFLGDTSSDKGKEENEKRYDLSSALDLDQDSLLNRRGATFRLRNPICPTIITNSVASASLERTSTTTGQLENIGSATLTLGPLRRLLPMGARSSISTTFTGGTRFQGNVDADVSGKGTSLARTSIGQLLPYTLASANTKQIFPISFSQGDDDTTPITLALQHTVSMSTPNLPRHEAKAMGNSAQIRGASADGIASSTVKGTTEIRIPVAAPRIGSGTVVLFGDWFCIQKDLNSPFYSKSTIGIGIRKSIQGLPLKYDISYSSEGKVKRMFGMGIDFDV